MFNVPRKAGNTTQTKQMKKDKNIVMLLYRIQRYRAMGNGAMCQSLMSELNKLRSNKTARC